MHTFARPSSWLSGLRLFGEFIPANRVDYYSKLLIGHKIVEVIDVAMLDEDDIVSLTTGTGDAPICLVLFLLKARTFMDGFASMSARAAAVCAGPLQTSSSSRSSVAKSVMSNVAAATK